MKIRDALVVGGGPAGLAAAIALRQRGLDVMLADALVPPIDKACGEGLLPDARVELARLGVTLSPSEGVEFEGLLFANHCGVRREQAVAGFPHGRGIGIRRLQLHRRLTCRAESLGVYLRWGEHVELTPGQPVRIGGEEIRFRYLIGADGSGSRTRRWAGLDSGSIVSRRFGFRRHYRIEPWSRWVEIHWSRLGQVYVTPVSADEVCVATIVRSPRLRMDEMLASVPWLSQRLAGAPVATKLRGAVTITQRLDRVVAGNVALVGDASGSVDAITGEGMAGSFRQARLLAESIEKGSLEEYGRRHEEVLALPRSAARVMLAMDRFDLFRARAIRMLARDPRIFERMLRVHVGEESLASFLLRRGLYTGWQFLAAAGA